MIEFTKMERDITEFKPKMHAVYVKNLADLRTIPFRIGETAQVKADGEFSLIHVDRESAYAINRFGRKTENLPALEELHVQFLRFPKLKEAEFLAELYAIDGQTGKPLPLPKFIHLLKGGDAREHIWIRIGLFDFVKLVGDGEVSPKYFDSSTKFRILKDFESDLKLVHVLDYIMPKDAKAVEAYYAQKVDKDGWEGLVIRTNGDTYKAKPNCDVDAVIIGINKNNKGYSKGIAKSVKVALMPTEGSFVELGDATVAREDEARAVFELTKAKVNENDKTVFVKPLLVVKIDYISLFPDTTNSVYKLLLGGMTEIGTMKAVRMKSPRVVGYRKDKHACTNDVGLNQIDA